MAENSKIEWTHHTFNPWIGCQKVHTGCTNCYAETLMDKRYGKVQWGPNGSRQRTSDANWRKPIAWNKAAAAVGERHRVFCASLADVFEDWTGPIVDPTGTQLHRVESATGVARYVPRQADVSHGEASYMLTMGQMRADLFRLIDATPHLDWLLLTKRPENVMRMWPGMTCNCGSGSLDSGQHPIDCTWRNPRRENVWLGTSISDEVTAVEFTPRLIENRHLCPVLFLSAEPLLGPIPGDFVGRTLCPDCDEGMVDITGDGGLDFFGPRCAKCNGEGRGIDWIIVGGESGQGRRPMELEWARSLRDQCQSAGVAFFMKQIDKVQPIPDDLLIREFPHCVTATGGAS